MIKGHAPSSTEMAHRFPKLLPALYPIDPPRGNQVATFRARHRNCLPKEDVSLYEIQTKFRRFRPVQLQKVRSHPMP